MLKFSTSDGEIALQALHVERPDREPRTAVDLDVELRGPSIRDRRGLRCVRGAPRRRGCGATCARPAPSRRSTRACRNTSPSLRLQPSRASLIARRAERASFAAGPLTSTRTSETRTGAPGSTRTVTTYGVDLAIDRDLDLRVVEPFDGRDLARLRGTFAREQLEQLRRHLLVGLPAREVEARADRVRRRVRPLDDEPIADRVARRRAGRGLGRVLRGRGSGASEERQEQGECEAQRAACRDGAPLGRRPESGFRQWRQSTVAAESTVTRVERGQAACSVDRMARECAATKCCRSAR